MTGIPRHPSGRAFGTMHPDWTAEQIRRAEGDTRPAPRFDADQYRRMQDQPARFADLHSSREMRTMEAIGRGCQAFLMIAGALFIGAQIAKAMGWM